MIGRIDKSPQLDIFRIPLRNTVESNHPLFMLAGRINWDKMISGLSIYYSPDKGRHSIPLRKPAGLVILKYLYGETDENILKRWQEEDVLQYFCGEVFSQHDLPFGRSELVRFRHRIGKEGMAAIFSPENLMLMNEYFPNEGCPSPSGNTGGYLFRMIRHILKGKA